MESNGWSMSPAHVARGLVANLCMLGCPHVARWAGGVTDVLGCRSPDTFKPGISRRLQFVTRSLPRLGPRPRLTVDATAITRPDHTSGLICATQ